jgi:hypothetical protein
MTIREITDETYARYNNMASNFVAQFANETDRDDVCDMAYEELIVASVYWFLDSDGRWSRSYVRQLSAALKQRIDNLCSAELIAVELGNKLSKALEEDRPASKTEMRKASASSVKNANLRRLIDYFRNEKNGFSSWIAGYLQVGSRLGWRPGEVVRTWLDGKYVCAVAEKNTQSRGLCGTCEIALHEYGPELIAKLALWISETQRWANEYGGRANLLSVVLTRVRRACVQLRIPHMDLYTLRHFAIASMKKSGYSREEIAVLVNHASTRTAGEHYGKARIGSKRAKKRFRIDAWRLSLVRKTARQFPGPNRKPTIH